jgi:hypothetical protein
MNYGFGKLPSMTPPFGAIEKGRHVMRGCVLFLALLSSVCLTVPSIAAANCTALRSINVKTVAAQGLVTHARHRCFPSRCRCAKDHPTICTRDCRLDRHCWCWGGKYVCHIFRKVSPARQQGSNATSPTLSNGDIIDPIPIVLLAMERSSGRRTIVPYWCFRTRHGRRQRGQPS